MQGLTDPFAEDLRASSTRLRRSRVAPHDDTVIGEGGTLTMGLLAQTRSAGSMCDHRDRTGETSHPHATCPDPAPCDLVESRVGFAVVFDTSLDPDGTISVTVDPDEAHGADDRIVAFDGPVSVATGLSKSSTARYASLDDIRLGDHLRVDAFDATIGWIDGDISLEFTALTQRLVLSGDLRAMVVFTGIAVIVSGVQTNPEDVDAYLPD